MIQKTNMQYLYITVIAAVITFMGVFGSYNYMPVEPIEILGEQMLGTSITTIEGSDTLKNSRTTINDNFSALNSGKMEMSTTSVDSITTLDNLATAGSLGTVGTIGSGVWQGTDVGVAYGGTGVSTLTAYGVLLGNGASAISTVSGLGSNDQVLTSNGAGSAPTWQSTAVDETADYAWTGTQSWAMGSSTFNDLTYLNGFTTANDILISSSTVNYDTASSSIASVGFANTMDDTCTNGTVAYNSTGSKTIAHGLGQVPARIKFYTTGAGSSQTGIAINSICTATGASDEICVYTDSAGDGALDSGNIIKLEDSNAVWDFEAAVTSFDATNVTINVTTRGSSQTAQVLWEICK